MGLALFMEIKKLQVVIETPEYIKQAKLCMDDTHQKAFIDYIAANPLKGDVISGTGGARKIRWASDLNSGKSGGARVIYYYHNQSMPIFLFTIYAKNKKENITQNERNILKTIISKIVESYEECDNE